MTRETPVFPALLAALLAFGLIARAAAEPRRFVIDPEHFTVGFLVEHVGYADTLGMFREAEGEFVYDEASNELKSGRVTINAPSVFTAHKDRDGHLRSGEFLDVANHPEIRFQATEYQADGAGGGQLTGNLTILGKTRPVTFDIRINKTAKYPFGHGEYTLGASARTVIKRSKWGMTYALDGNLVGDEVGLILEFEANRQ